MDVEQLPASMRGARLASGSARSRRRRILAGRTRTKCADSSGRWCLRALRECGWRKAECARTLGVARGYLHRLINQLGIQEGEGISSATNRPKYCPPSVQSTEA